MTHTYHPHVWAPDAGQPTGPILADGCPRCEEIASDPTAHLDQRRITELHHRADTDTPPMSRLDAQATTMLKALHSHAEYA